MITLSEKAIEKIRGSRDLKNKLMCHFGCSERTLYNYISNNDPKLTMHSILDAIIEHTGLGLSEVLNKP